MNDHRIIAWPNSSLYCGANIDTKRLLSNSKSPEIEELVGIKESNNNEYFKHLIAVGKGWG